MTLAALQARLQALVGAEPLLTGRPVLIEDKQNLVSQVDAALATVAMCAVIAPVSGEVKPGPTPRRAATAEVIEIAVHRSHIDAESVSSTVAVLDALRARIHGALVQADNPSAGTFSYLGHELREIGDGAYVRILLIGATVPLGPAA